MFKVSYHSWHSELYHWWYEKKYGHPKAQPVSNLCPYMRVVLFWAPLRILFWDWVEVFGIPTYLISFPTILAAIPIIGYLRGHHKFAARMWEIYGLSIAIILAFILLIYIIASIERWAKRRKANRVEKPPKPPGVFWPMVGAYMKSGHDRICPEICFIGAPEPPCPDPGPEPYCDYGDEPPHEGCGCPLCLEQEKNKAIDEILNDKDKPQNCGGEGNID